MMRLILLVAVTEEDDMDLWGVSLDGLNMGCSKQEQGSKDKANKPGPKSGTKRGTKLLAKLN